MQYSIQKAVDLLKSGSIIVIETDTIHALTCDAYNQKAVLNVYKLKNRPFNKALPIFVKDIEQATCYAIFNEAALKMAKTFWPGALTLILPIANNTSLAPALYQGMTSIAIRIPNNQFALKLIENVNRPIVGTSANLSGETTQLYEEDIRKVLGNEIDIFISNKEPLYEIKQSTIVCFQAGKPKIIREGAISSSKIINSLE
ncbi:L-threonylcarbamoyladenylate synthase [Candidatus Lariskella endosymbiont of Hedychridium roseum]|uniref:L-threonylcarbamoyladenylate synthase n=1 Tax=Candidatus Lariskella endosymbiont of Hedychridium roseum TaxID=3077949 RepID=UPI0030CC2A08